MTTTGHDLPICFTKKSWNQDRKIALLMYTLFVLAKLHSSGRPSEYLLLGRFLESIINGANAFPEADVAT